jgi:hypothetical protein
VSWDRSAILAALPVAAVAVIAGVVSYSHIAALGLRTGQSPADAHLLPLAVDGLIVAGSVILLAGSLLGWLAVVPGIVATVFANVESGLPHGPLAATVAAWPALAFSLASFTLERWLKSRAKPAPAADSPCGHIVAETLEETVVRAYLHGRDCLGQPPSQRHLAATFNVSRPKVAELVGSLNGQHPPGTGEPLLDQ